MFDLAGLKQDQFAHGLPLRKEWFVPRKRTCSGAGRDLKALAL
jgi:hypothetical protein